MTENVGSTRGAKTKNQNQPTTTEKTPNQAEKQPSCNQRAEFARSSNKRGYGRINETNEQ